MLLSSISLYLSSYLFMKVQVIKEINENIRVLIIGFIAIILSGCASYSGNSISDSSDPWKAVNAPVFVMNDTIDSRIYLNLLLKVIMHLLLSQ